MSVTSINGSSCPMSNLQSGMSRISSAHESDNNGNRAAGINGKGQLSAAISQLMSQLGISAGNVTNASASSSTTDTSGATAPQDSQQAVATFMQSLYAALQAQSGTSGAASSRADHDANSASSVSGATTANATGHHHHGGLSKLEHNLQSLMQQLSSDSANGSSNPTLDNLQQSFTNLLGAENASGKGTNLTSFLQNLSQNLQGTAPTGNVVRTQA